MYNYTESREPLLLNSQRTETVALKDVEDYMGGQRVYKVVRTHKNLITKFRATNFPRMTGMSNTT